MFRKMKKDIAEKEASSPMQNTPKKRETQQPSTPNKNIPPQNAESPLFPAYHTPAKNHPPPSDTESEADEPMKNIASMNKDDLVKGYQKQERMLSKLKGKYTDLAMAYKELEKEKDKVKSIMTQSQDKALRRVAELKEAADLDRQAKLHMEETFTMQLDEKDEMLNVYQTQIQLLKRGEDPDGLKPKSAPESPKQEHVDDSTTDETVKNLREKIKRLEALLNKCKETIKGNKDKNNQLIHEKDNRMKEIEQLKEQHKVEKTKFVEQLSNAKEEVDKSLEEKAIAIAEAKQQMHEELEERDQRNDSMHASFRNLTSEKDNLQAKFSDSENRVSDLQDQLQKLEKQGEEERQNLAQELSRGKQAVIKLMKTLENMEKSNLSSSSLQTKQHFLRNFFP